VLFMMEGATPPPGFVLLGTVPQSIGGPKAIRVSIYRKQ